MSGAAFRNGVFVLPDAVPAGVHAKGMLKIASSPLNQTDLIQCYAWAFIDQRSPDNTNGGIF